MSLNILTYNYKPALGLIHKLERDGEILTAGVTWIK